MRYNIQNMEVFMSPISKQNNQLLIRGSVVLLRRRCGKDRCKCNKGELHETWALSCSYQGKTKIISISPEYLELARQSITRYQKAFSQLEAQALRGAKQLHTLIKSSKKSAR